MDAELLSRVQFALTASYHFIFPPLSMGLGFMLIVIGGVYLRTRDPKWRRLSFFWVKVYGVIFAMGVATGIVQEFEFGMNWADYSRFVGNVFGSLLAAEGVFAFFLEGGFLGLMLFGGNRLGPRLWFGATLMVVLGAHFSALWIIMANSWMQTPQGYMIVEDPAPIRAVMTDFAEVVFTPSFIPRLMHVFFAAWTVGSALMLSVSAWYVLRRRHWHLARSNLTLALPFFVFFALGNVLLFGPNQAIAVTQQQPLKLASMEGVWETQSCVPMYIVGWVDEAAGTTSGLSVPCLLSVLAGGSTDTVIEGLDAFEGDPAPPLNLVFQAYHLMLNLAGVLALIAVVAAGMFLWRRSLFRHRWALWGLVGSVFVGQIAITAGWWTAEIGRQPWVVYEVLLTSEGTSPLVTAEQIATSLGMFIVLYSVLFVFFLFLLNGKIQKGPEPLEDVETAAVSDLPDTFRHVFSRNPRRVR